MANPYEEPLDVFKEEESNPQHPVISTFIHTDLDAPVMAQPTHNTVMTPFAQPQTTYTSTEQPLNPAALRGHVESPTASPTKDAFFNGYPSMGMPLPSLTPPTSAFGGDAQPPKQQLHQKQEQQQQQQQQQQQEPQPAVQSSKIWTIEFYQQFFDVDTRLVLMRMTNTLVPINPPDFLMDREWRHNAVHEWRQSGVMQAHKPDLYGPFWICTTLWMLLGIASNIMSKIAFNHKSSGTDWKWKYDFTMASVASLVIYIYCFGFGTVVWGFMKFNGLPMSLVDTLCLYGYSMFLFIPVTILCMIPVSVFQWIIVVIGGVWSTAFLLNNMCPLWKATLSRARLLGMVSSVSVLHILLTLSFKFYFLHYDF